MKLPLHPIGGRAPTGADADENRAHLASLEAALEEKRAVVRAGWGPERVHRKGKLTTWERIEALKDPGSDVLSMGTLVNWDRDFPGSRRQAPGAGVVTAFVRIAERWTVLIANDTN